MADVVATQKGYFGGQIREENDPFYVPDEIWNDEKRRPSWAKLDPAKAFGGKGDHDDDGKVGGAKHTEKPSGRAKGKKGETVEAPAAEPFTDAPEPMTLAQATKDIGGVEPDWVAPKPID